MLLTIAAVLLTAIFFLAGINKINGFNNSVNGLINKLPIKSLQLTKLIVFIIMLLELIAPPVIVYATIDKRFRKPAYHLSLALILFTVLATLLYQMPPTGSKYMPFMLHMTTVGGLILLALHFR